MICKFSLDFSVAFLNIFLATVVEEVLRSFTEVKVATPQCRNTLLQVKVVHLKLYVSKSISIRIYLKYQK